MYPEGPLLQFFFFFFFFFVSMLSTASKIIESPVQLENLCILKNYVKARISRFFRVTKIVIPYIFMDRMYDSFVLVAGLPNFLQRYIIIIS